MFRPVYYFVLKINTQVIEIVTVPRYPDNKIAMFLRVLLRIFQCSSTYHIKLDMMSVHAEIASYQA